jgi:AcrR family transcriptional regulator
VDPRPATSAKLPSGRHGLDRDSVVSSQRSRLTAAMIAAVGEHGYAATTIGDVTGRAEVSRATFYEQFEDKEACFVSAYDELVGQVVGNFAGAYREGGTWPDRVRDGIDALLRQLAENPNAARVGIVEVIDAGPRAHERFREASDAFLPFIEEGRTMAPAGSELPPNLSRAVVGGIATLIVEEIYANGTEGLPRLLPELLYVALVPFVGDEAARAEMERESSNNE